MSIKKLSDTIASQIAAGEVVDRPVSVVKELIENAIDAGASEIQVVIRKAGRELIRVSDNGEGIPEDELELAVSRHATSKLSKTEELFDIKTLGFRGEALASIGSVSHLRLVSRPGNADVAAGLSVDGGANSAVQKAAAPLGTEITVEDLFYNVPARLKFLRKDITEAKHITGLVTRYAMAYPHIRWSLRQDDSLEFQSTGSNNRLEILQALFGTQEAKALMPLNFSEKDLAIEGFISDLSLTRSNRKDITLFVNGRWVQDPTLTAAVIKAYNTMLMVGRYPVVVLFLTIPTNLVDVNVHPTKAEVRFRDQDHVFSGVQRAIRRALLAYTPIPDLNSLNLWGRQTPAAIPTSFNENWQAQSPEGTEPEGAVETTQQQEPLPGTHLPLLRLVGQVASTYLVAEGPDGLYLIDQHAAHERVLFDQMMAQYRANMIPSQQLIDSVPVELSPDKAGILQANLEVMDSLGFVIEPFGPNTFLIRAIPTIVDRGDPKDAILSVVDAFEEDETPLENEAQALIAARVCKGMAVKGGQNLTEAEQRNLLLNLEASQSPRTCPHGRPTMIHLSANLLERQFGRRGAR
ncbi:MAG: DNA mismatch repair endonuclease MutL [Anaerolineaceae bacterium]|nr:DNA mismatch repair endonuclease MutL [Anaerolineaceae bacterium]MDD4042099.1 DNA mismatch repair endonuclease MutL [Anaerolineaceae bacterium]MDD4578307.1 DNA mismatch repair endonuclease MutL [Anaerolineaceae bacterium]